MSDIRKILEEFRSEGELDSTGYFTLDSKKAREKMKKYQLIDPHYYVLELVQAACAGNATFINVYVDSDDCIVTFDGEPYDRDDFESMYSSLFTSQHDMRLERFRELAIAVNSAMALNPKFIEIVSGDGKKSASLNITSPVKEEIKEYESDFDGTRIHIKERLTWDTAKRFFSGFIAKQLPTEGKVLNSQCIYCHIPITLNGEIINPPEKQKLQGVIFDKDIKLDHSRGMVGVPDSPYKLSHLQLMKWGVIINSRSMKLGYLPIIGYIEANRLIKNASQTDIVENEVYKKLMKDLSELAPQLLDSAVEIFGRQETQTDEKLLLAMKDILNQALRFEFRVDNFIKDPSPILLKIAPLPIFTTVSGKLISLNEIVEQYKKTGFVPYSQRCFIYEHPDKLKVLLIQDNDMKSLIDVMFRNRKRDVEADFGRSMLRDHNIALWSTRRTGQLNLQPGTFARKTFTDGSITGSLGLAQRNPDDFCRISFHKETGIICEKYLDLGGIYFDAVVNNDSLSPVYTWDDIETDSEFVKTIQALLMQLKPVYTEIAAQYTSHLENGKTVSESRRVHLIRYMSLLLKNTGEEQQESSATGKKKKAAKRVFHCKTGQTLFESRKTTPKDPNAIIEIPDMGLAMPEEFIYLRVFNTVSGGMVSLNDLQKDLEKYFKVHFLRKDMPGKQIDDRLIVVVKDKEEELLKRFFGWYKVEDYSNGFTQEQEAQKNLSRPEEQPEIKEDTIIKFPINIREIRGELGLLNRDDIDSYAVKMVEGKITQTVAATVKVLKMNRYITTIKMEFPIHGIAAALNSDRISVNKSWDQIIENEQYKELRQAVIQGLKEIAAFIIDQNPDLNVRENFRQKRFLFEFAGYWLCRIDYQKKINPQTNPDSTLSDIITNTINGYLESVSLKNTPVKIPTPDDILKERLMQTKLFRTTENSVYASLEDLWENKRKFGKIAYVGKEIAGRLENERMIPILSTMEENAVRSVLGKDSLENVESILKANQAFEYIKNSKPRQQAVISAVDPLVKLNIDEEGITGEIGITGTGRLTNKGVVVMLLKESRSINSRSFDYPIHLEACINYDKLKPMSNWSDVVEDENYKKVVECLKRHSFKALTTLFEKYNIMSIENKAKAEIYFLTYLIHSFGTYSDVVRSKSDSFVMKLASLRILPVLGGRKISLAELIEYYKVNNKIPYVNYAAEHDSQGIDEIILVLNGETHGLLKKMFYNFRECTQDLQLRKIAEKNMEKPPVEKLSIDSEYIYKVQINKAGITGELGIPAQYLSSEKILFTRKMIPVVEKNLYSQSRIFGILESPEFRTDKAFTDVTLFQSEKRTILEYIYKLYSGLADLYPGMEEAITRETARQFLLSFYIEQKFQVQTEFRIMESKLEKKIGSLPLLPISDGRYAGIDVALNSAERLGYIGYIHTGDKVYSPVDEIVFRFDDFDFDYSFCKKLAGSDKVRYQKELTIPPVQIEPLSSHEEGLKAEHVETVRDSAPAPEGESVSVSDETVRETAESQSLREPELTPDQKLLYALRREFRLIRETGDYKLSDDILQNMNICSKEGQPPVLFNGKTSTLLINTVHPFIGTLTGRLEQTPEAIYYLLSVIYSTINRELKEIEDRDELAFQMVMLDYLLKPAKISNKKPDALPV